MSNKSYGLNKERELKKMFLDEGALQVDRSRGSFGAFDLTVWFDDSCYLVSCKATKRKTVSFKKEIENIRKSPSPEYCTKLLCIYWSPNKERKKKGWEFIKVLQDKTEVM